MWACVYVCTRTRIWTCEGLCVDAIGWWPVSSSMALFWEASPASSVVTDYTRLAVQQTPGTLPSFLPSTQDDMQMLPNPLYEGSCHIHIDSYTCLCEIQQLQMKANTRCCFFLCWMILLNRILQLHPFSCKHEWALYGWEKVLCYARECAHVWCGYMRYMYMDMHMYTTVFLSFLCHKLV